MSLSNHLKSAVIEERREREKIKNIIDMYMAEIKIKKNKRERVLSKDQDGKIIGTTGTNGRFLCLSRYLVYRYV